MKILKCPSCGANLIEIGVAVVIDSIYNYNPETNRFEKSSEDEEVVECKCWDCGAYYDGDIDIKFE